MKPANVIHSVLSLIANMRPHQPRKTVFLELTHGSRFETLVPDKRDQEAIFKRLEKYIGKTISDLITLSDQPWQAVEAFRIGRKPSNK